jgi:hypothetical protein
MMIYDFITFLIFFYDLDAGNACPMMQTLGTVCFLADSRTKRNIGLYLSVIEMA